MENWELHCMGIAIGKVLFMSKFICIEIAINKTSPYHMQTDRLLHNVCSSNQQQSLEWVFKWASKTVQEC